MAPHPTAARGFGSSAGAYERGRPSYPDGAVAHLAAELGLGPGVRVVDLAAGTGKLTRLLAEGGAEVVAVEPVTAMREALEQAVPGVEALDGTAEAIPLPDASVDVVTAGQAFHWFRADEALREIHRVLRPGGGLALVWNTRDEKDALQRALTELTESLRSDTPAWRRLDPAAAIEVTGFFEPVELVELPHRQELDAEGIVDRFCSISFVAAAPPEARTAFVDSLRALVRGRPEPIVLPYVTELYLTQRG
jgi:SAM-dependent methyltransferase